MCFSCLYDSMFCLESTCSLLSEDAESFPLDLGAGAKAAGASQVANFSSWLMLVGLQLSRKHLKLSGDEHVGKVTS